MNSFILPLGLIAFLQVVFLPGWLILRALKVEETLPKKLIYAFGLSLMANYLAIFALASFHAYTAFSYALIILAEICILSRLYRKETSLLWRTSVVEVFDRIQKNILHKIRNIPDRFLAETNEAPRRVLFFLSFLFSIASFFYIGYLFMTNIGTVFNLNDALLSWNRWAVEWSQNRIPPHTWEYPQLIPTNWSLFYVIIGAPIQFFAKSIMPLFMLGLISAMFIIGIRKKTLAFIMAVPATVLLMRVMNGSEIAITEGYADTALAFFSTISLLSLFEIEKKNTARQNTQYLFLGALFALGAAMTKQGGLYIMFLYPLLAWIIASKDLFEFRKNAMRYLSIYVGGILMFVFPFYAYKALSFASNSDVSVVPQIMDQLYGKGGPGNPLKHILETFIFLGKKTYGIFPLFFFLTPFSLKDKKYRHLAYLILLPYFFIWLFFAGYDARNLSLILPILSIGACIGIEALVAAHSTRIARILNRTNVFAVGAGFIALLCLTSGITSKKILEGKRLAERELYDKEASLRISEYFESASGGEKIYTNFPVLQWMPATKDRLYRPYGEDFFGDDFKGYGKETEKPSRFSYILAAPYTDQKIKDDIQAKIEAKQYTLIFQLRGYVLVKREK